MIEHGGNVEQIAKRLGVATEQLIDFSANINPLGIPNSVKGIWNSLLEKMDYYPDIHYVAPREKIAEHEQVDLENVLLCNGAAQAFFELAQAINPERLLVLAPTFLEYKQAFQQAKLIEVPLQEANDYTWQYEDLENGLSQLDKGDVVLICNPNNPTGSLVSVYELQKLAEYTKNKGIYCIFDEAFIDFVDDMTSHTFVPYLKEYTNVIVVKSLTKFYAIPGLRLGYVLTGNHELLHHIASTRVPWSVNGVSVALVSILLEDVTYQEQTKLTMAKERQFLYEQLKQFPFLKVYPPSVNYIFFQYKGEGDLKQLLLRDNIVIRHCANYTNTTQFHYRIAVKSREDNKKIITALKAIR